MTNTKKLLTKQKNLNIMTYSFNEEEYLEMYPDVADAVLKGKIKSGLTHYLRFGKEEGRRCCRAEPFKKKPVVKKGSRLDRLIASAKNNGTDKLDHGYLNEYSKRLPSKVKNLLEVGVKKGASIKMWKEVLNCDITGFDLFAEFDPRVELESLGVSCIQGDEHYVNDLLKIKDDFQVIVLDGSHHAGLEQLTFYHLFLNNMKSKGLFVWEDIHTSLDKYYYGKQLTEFEDTALHFLSCFESGNPVTTKFIDEEKLSELKNVIDSVEVVNNKIAFIWRK
jgi:hypothetical protein